MDGVIIISESVGHEFIKTCMGWSPIILLYLTICAVAAFITIRYATKDDTKINDVVAIVSTTIGVLFLTIAMLTVLTSGSSVNRYNMYEVILTDNVDVNEFLHRYEVLEVNDGSYMVRDIVEVE